MDLGLTDQVVFVAGSSRGIGRAIACALLTEGARIVLTGRDADSLERARAEIAQADSQARILAIRADLTDAASARDCIDRTISHFGRLDHLVANLGNGSGTPGPTPPDTDWTRLFEMNFFASVRLTEYCLPHLHANPLGGSILYISSIAALETTPAPLPYSAAKAALTNYAKNLSRHLAPQRIRVNTIAPGNIFFAGGSWELHLNNRRDAVEAMLRNEVPQQRFGSPEDVASLAAYLCSSHASFSTGATYVVDGGQTHSI
jgi:3-oxoacyl-[acyl-carrier protein] reductase